MFHSAHNRATVFHAPFGMTACMINFFVAITFFVHVSKLLIALYVAQRRDAQGELRWSVGMGLIVI